MNVEIVSYTLIISYKVINSNIQFRTTSIQKGHATIVHPFLHQLDIWVIITSPG